MWPQVTSSIMNTNLWGADEVRSEHVLLTRSDQYQRLQCLRPMTMAKPSLGHTQEEWQAFL